MPGDKNGKYVRVNPSDHTNHGQPKMTIGPTTEAKPMSTAKKSTQITASNASIAANKTAVVSDPLKSNPSVVVSKDYKADSPVNKPRSANEATYPTIKPGAVNAVKGVTEGSGSKTTAGDPSFSPIDSHNKLMGKEGMPKGMKKGQ